MASVLLYGFGPYGPFPDNVTERTLRALRPPPGVALRVFAVRADQRLFESALTRLRPAVVIGLGQHPRARKLRLERRAHAPGDPSRARFATLTLPRARDTTVTYDAGDYVCNFSMWVAAGWCARHGARFAFVHVPRRFAPRRLEAYLRRCLRQLEALPAKRPTRPRTGAAGRSSPRGPGRSR